jgi:hypothetical protein
MGPAGSGKTTVANYLVEKYGAVRFSLAAPLKEMVGRALELSHAQLWGTQEEKEAIDPRYGKSARWFLQRFGTEGCRQTFGEDFWTRMCFTQILKTSPRIAVIDDMRFVNEAEMCLLEPKFNGYVWRLHPVLTANAEVSGHASEQEWSTAPASFEIRPERFGVEDLYELVDRAMAETPRGTL